MIKRPLFFVPAVLIIGGIGFVILRYGRDTSGSAITVKRGAITQEVSVTGKTKPSESVELAFETGGKIARRDVKVGDRVAAGQTLVTLDLGKLNAGLGQAEANLESEKAKLDELKRGTRPEEVRVQETKVENAKTALEDARKNLKDKIQDAYTKADDAVRTKADQVFSSPRSSNPQFNFTIDNASLKSDIERGRPTVESLLSEWRIAQNALDDLSDLEFSTRAAKNYLETIRGFLDNVALAAGYLRPTVSLAQATIDGYKSDISTARANINAAAANLTSAAEKFRSAGASLTLEENQLDLKRAGSSPEEIAGAEAKVKQAEASVAGARADISKAILRAPASGTISRQDAKVGEVVAANKTLVSIISESDLEIESNVPEVDIGKIRIGNPVKITLDAFPAEEFSGKVTYIDPAETIVDGVVNFKVTIVFDRADQRLKSGLTANLTIETLKKPNTLILPQFAIVENDLGTFVRKREGNKITEVPVKIGVRGQEGSVEILEGVEEGARVLNIGLKAAK